MCSAAGAAAKMLLLRHIAIDLVGLDLCDGSYLTLEARQ
jgi:hypothetical protein